jgi:TadE-like protein
MTRRTGLYRDQCGATAAEFALVLPIFLLFLLGLIDVGRYAWAINEAEKATQIGARWAVVTDMVPAGLASYSFAVDGGVPQGTTVDDDLFGSISCHSTGGAVSCDTVCAVACDWDADIDSTAFARIVARMRLIYPAIQADNVVIDYVNSGLGYSGDPNGPDVAPLVTVRLRNMGFPMFFMLGQRVSLPNFSYALTLEDAEGTIAN